MINQAMPMTPEPDPCDYRAQSAPVSIQTIRDGDWHQARWTVYQDPEIGAVWELVGSALQLDRDEVLAWRAS